MKNYVSKGRCITVIADAPVRSSEPVLVGSMFGIPAISVQVGESYELYVEGIWQLRKDQSKFRSGDPAYFEPDVKSDKGSKVGIGLVTANKTETCKHIGSASEDAGISDAMVRVRLNGISLQ